MPEPLRYVPLSDPTRVIDTREGIGNGAITPGFARLISIATADYNPAGIPASAQAFALNVTVVPATEAAGWLSIYPRYIFQPSASTLNFHGGAVANHTTVYNPTTSTGGGDIPGQIAIFVSAQADIIIDVLGYYVP